MSSPDSSPTLSPGSSILGGKLRVERVIGSGGMGVVYEVEHELTKHRRALKVLHARAAQQPVIVERFLREASAAGRIGNSHIAETFDAGRLDTGEPYLLMELVDGETLDQRLRGGPIPVGELCDLMHQACEGVQAAHDAGIVHRDLKPENLIVTEREGAPFVKILDFGISKFDTDRTGTFGITAEGSLMGTPYYMSPEQVRGTAALDGRTDVYSLGVILYECACAARPYDARSIEALAVMIHEGKAAPLHERRPELSQVFCAVVEKAMVADRERRFQTAHDLADALAPMRVPATLVPRPRRSHPVPRAVVRPAFSATLKQDAPASAMPSLTEAAMAKTMGSLPGATPSRSRAVPIAAAVAVLALGAGGAAIVFSHAREPVPVTAPAPAVAPAPPHEELTALPTVVLAPLSSTIPPSTIPLARPVVTDAPRAVPEPATSASAARHGAAAAPSATASSSKSRVDQTGLAGDNPFR